jgi:class 3 adenylate cyclase
VGVHSGPVVAGIVGFKKFAYDIWGDTVNIASRMETMSETGRVNISEDTLELVNGHFSVVPNGIFETKTGAEVRMFLVEEGKR